VKLLIRIILIAVAALPIGLTLTLFLMPFWRWLEESTGIESIGHSGPSSWSYVFVYAIVLITGIIIWRVYEHRSL